MSDELRGLRTEQVREEIENRRLRGAERKATVECRFNIHLSPSQNLDERNLHVVGTARRPSRMVIVELPLIFSV